MARGVSKELAVRAKLDARKFSTGAQNMRRDMSKISRDAKFVGNSIKAGFAGVALSSVLGMVKGLNKMTIEADQLNKKTEVVFGEYNELVTRTAETTAMSMGMSIDGFRKATVSITDLLVPMGFARQEAVKMSLDVVNLSGALSEWSNGQYTAEEAAHVVAKAILGETEQMKNLGIKVDQTSKLFRQQVADTMALKNITLEQAKAVEILNQIQNKSIDAQTAFASNQDSIARKTAQLNAKIQNQQDAMAQDLIPVMAFFVNVASTAVDQLTDWDFAAQRAAESAKKMGEAIGGINDEAEKVDINKINKMFGIGLITDSDPAKSRPSDPFPANAINRSHLGSIGVDNSGFSTAVGSPLRGVFGGNPMSDVDFEPTGADFMDQPEEMADSLSSLSETAEETGNSFRDMAGQLVTGSALASNSIKDFVTNSVGALKDQAIAGLITKIFSDPSIPTFAAIGLAAGASALVNGLFGALMGGSGGGSGAGGGVAGGRGFATRRDYGPGASDFTGLGNLSFTLEGTTLVAAINRTNGRLGRVQGNG